MTEQPIKINERPPFIRKIILSIAAFPFVLLVGTWAFTPGYIVPFLNNPIGRLEMIGLGIWEIIGFALLYIFCPRSKGLAITAVTIVALVNAGPLTLATLLGPALFASSTEHLDLGPIMGGSR